MEPVERAAIMIARCTAAFVTISAMIAANEQRGMNGEPLAYDEAAFMAVIDEYGIDHNAVVSWFQS